MEALLNEIKSLKKRLDLNKILVEVFSDERLKREIIDRVRYVQLFRQGVDEANVIIGTYSPYTERINPAKKAGTHYTLLDTGAFYGSFRILVGDTYFIIDADGDKEDGNIFVRFDTGNNLIGLTEENIEWLKKKLIPLINAKIETVLQ